MSTIRDVAQQAQVSTATVSATLNNSAYVSPDLKARVFAAVEALGYAPSGIAKSLKTGKTRLLALVVADVSNPFFTALINAVETAAYDWGYALMLCNSDEKFERERHHLEPDPHAALRRHDPGADRRPRGLQAASPGSRRRRC